jgi:hypothetical protein
MRPESAAKVFFGGLGVMLLFITLIIVSAPDDSGSSAATNATLKAEKARNDAIIINFATSPAQPADSYHVTQFTWGCYSPAAAYEMLIVSTARHALDAALPPGHGITREDQIESSRAAALNCIALLPTSAFALNRDEDDAPAVRYITDATGERLFAVAGAILIPPGGEWKFWVPVGIVENAQTFTPLQP